MERSIHTRVCVLGAGAGGTGCVYRLIEKGIPTVVVDRNPDFGGCAVFSGVDGWEPGVSLEGLHQLLAEELEKAGQCHVVLDVPNCNLLHPENADNWSNHSFKAYPWGWAVPCKATYADTLYRCTSLQQNRPTYRLQFQPEAMTRAIRTLLSPYEAHLTTLFGWHYESCTVTDGRITDITVTNGQESCRITADYFVDASGDIVLARSAGCDHTMGTEGFDVYSEPSATEPSNSINAVSYVFRIAKTDDPDHIDPIPEALRQVDIQLWADTKMRRIVSCFTQNTDGQISVNMLPTMQGQEYFALGEKADQVGHARVWAYWNYLQREKNLNGYTLTQIYAPGIRESWRLRGQYVLREQDLRRGHAPEEAGPTLAIADHALDIHGKGGMCKELETPYAIPLGCAIPKELSNLFVACRGASFSHIAASSARLTRTMLSMGEGVGRHIASVLLRKP